MDESLVLESGDPRAAKAVAAATACATWQPVTAFRVPSSTTPGRSYLVTDSFCQCRDFSVNGRSRACHHILALRLAIRSGLV